MYRRALIITLATVLLTGCGGGKPLVSPNLIGRGTVTPARKQAIAHFVITIPVSVPGELKAKYVSTATKSISIGLTGSTTATKVVNVTPGQTTYNVDVEAFDGSNTFTISLYDAPDATGNVLSTAQVTTAISTNQADVVNVTTSGVPASIQLSLDNLHPFKVSASSVNLTVAAKDASGSTIVGPYSATIALTNSDSSGAVVLTATTVTSPGVVAVNYNGAIIGPVTLGATAPGVLPGNVTTATLTPKLRPNGGVVTTFAGNGTFGNGTGTAARFYIPTGVGVFGNGDIFVADANNYIRAVTPAGVVTTFTDKLSSPILIAVDSSGNVYVTERSRHTIRKITSGGTVITLAGNGTAGFADGTGTAAQFNFTSGYPGVAIDSNGNVFVGDCSNYRVRKITTDGVVTTLAGDGTSGYIDGTGTGARFAFPTGVAVDSSDNIYVADANNQRIRKIDTGGVVTTLAGSTSGFTDGTGTAAQFKKPLGVAVDSNNNLYVADQTDNRVRKITSGGVVTTLAGNGTSGFADGTSTSAMFSAPEGVTVDGSGNVYVADTINDRIRKIDTSGVVTTFVGDGHATDGVGTSAQFNYPRGLSVDRNGNILVTDTLNNMVRKITPGGVVTTVAGQRNKGTADGVGTAAQFNFDSYPYLPSTAVDSDGNIYVTDTLNYLIRKIDTGGTVTTLAGSTQGFAEGTGSAAQFKRPSGIVLDSAGNIYVADGSNFSVRKITSGGVVTTLAGNGTSGFADGTGTSAQFKTLTGLAIDSNDNLIVADTGGNRIRKVTLAGVVTTVAGNGTAGFADGTGSGAQFSAPRGVAVDSDGNIYVADINNQRIRLVTPDGIVTSIAGDGTQGAINGTGAAAKFANPFGIAVDSNGALYVTEGALVSSTNLIRKIQ